VNSNALFQSSFSILLSSYKLCGHFGQSGPHRSATSG
jgi:hypothetical protein